jgi:hypothetical protein
VDAGLTYCPMCKPVCYHLLSLLSGISTPNNVMITARSSLHAAYKTHWTVMVTVAMDWTERHADCEQPSPETKSEQRFDKTSFHPHLLPS